MKPRKVVLGYFDSPEMALDVSEKARERGFRELDLIGPYAVHGFEQALGLKESRVPWIAKTFLALGALLAFLLQAWTSSTDWPINVGGKPLVSWPAFVPIIFEGAVLLAGLSTFLALMHFLRAYPFKRPRIYNERLTNDRFALVIPFENDGDSGAIVDFLKGCGVDEIERHDS